MYSIWIATGVALLVGVGGFLADIWGWFGAIFFTLVAFAVTWILIARRFGKKLQPEMEKVQNLMKGGQMMQARQVLLDLLPLGNWIPLLKGQLMAQVGLLSHHLKDPERAMEYLTKGSRRAGDAQMTLATIHYRNGDLAQADAALKAAAPFNRKHSLLFNFHAWLLAKEGKANEAMERLAMFLQKVPDNEPTKDNLLRLQNGKKMNMKPFGAEWYALQFERPPASYGQGQLHPGHQAYHAQNAGRKGFRQPRRKKR